MPLANDIRPKHIDKVIGQQHLVGENGMLRKMLDSGHLVSMIFYGPPATGKTTLATLVSQISSRKFATLSAVMDGKQDLKKVLADLIPELDLPKTVSKIPARVRTRFNPEDIFSSPVGQNQIDTEDMTTKDFSLQEFNPAESENSKPGILFIDEIHRWSKSQQDALLPYVEAGQIVLIGATTENPSFNIINPLLSRTQVVVFNPLSQQDIRHGLIRGYLHLSQSTSLSSPKILESLEFLAAKSNGDLRYALNILEILYAQNPQISLQDLAENLQRKLNYDKNGDEHYNLISALHKSIRSSNPSAAVYWLVRMLEGGEDILYIARRLLRIASEDIGNINPNALLLANQVFEVCQKLGLPEANLALVQLVEFLANSPKNNLSYTAYQKAKADVDKFGNLPVPKHLLNAPTALMKDWGYGQGYEYDHDLASKKSNQQCLPDELEARNYFG